MKRLWIAIAVLTCATVGHAGKAEAGYVYYTGSELLERCESDQVAKQNTCVGYLAGIADITDAYEDWGLIDEYFCIPNNVKTTQLGLVVIKGLNEVPEKLHMDAARLVLNIFAKAFRCD